MEKIKMLFVEDDASFAFVVKGSLELSGIYEVQTAPDGKEGLIAYESFNPDVVVADIEMPVLNGMEMVSQIRKTNRAIPILLASGHTSARYVLDGYKLNADNYIKKPFVPEELDAHIQAVLRRTRLFPNVNNSESICLGDTVFNSDKQFIQYKNTTCKLSAREAKILHRLYESRGNVVKRNELLEAIWGTSDFFSSRSLDVFINLLRKRLSPDPKINIETIRGKGLALNIT
jgi:DNA-binding response OmpR family regulator